MVSEDLDSVTFSSNQSEDNGGSVLGNRSWRRKIMDNLPSALKVSLLLPQCFRQVMLLFTGSHGWQMLKNLHLCKRQLCE